MGAFRIKKYFKSALRKLTRELPPVDKVVVERLGVREVVDLVAHQNRSLFVGGGGRSFRSLRPVFGVKRSSDLGYRAC